MIVVLIRSLVVLATLIPTLAWSQIRFDDPSVVADPAREWTLMVYLDADNDLEPFALRDLNELESGLAGKGVEVIVLIDRAEGYEEGFGNWTDSRLLRIRPDRDPARLVSEVLARPGEINMGDPEVLRSFVAATINKFPARHHALVMWDHGGGWKDLAIDHQAPGSAEGHDGLNIAEVGCALQDALAAVAVDKLDLIGFDMCLMAQLETAWEVKDLARVMVASQAVEPGDGWPYAEVLGAFQRHGADSRQIGKAIVEAYGTYYGAAGRPSPPNPPSTWRASVNWAAPSPR